MSRRTSETPQGMWLGGAWKGCLWLCYAGHLDERQKVRSQVIGEDRSRFPGRGTVGEVRRGGRRASNRAKERVYRFWFNLSKREEQVACHASALALTMTDKARREAEM